MVYYDHHIVSAQMIYHSWLGSLRQKSVETSSNHNAYIYRKALDLFQPIFQKNDLVDQVLNLAENIPHVMEFSFSRIISTLISYLKASINAIESHQNHFKIDSQIPNNILEGYLLKKLIIGLITCSTGDTSYSEKKKMIDFIKSFQMVRFPTGDILQYEVSISTGDWIPFLDRVKNSNIVVDEVKLQDTIIKTTDTLFYESLIFSFLEERKPILLCGPPGCGKSMMILSCLRELPDIIVSVINFSSTSNPQMLQKTLSNFCTYKKTPHGTSLIPKYSKRLVGKLA